ncbi:MAG: AraC family transcriptional regulator [bacterium]|nr:AraC family transcriptional regulator [bacterium]
MIDSLYKQLFFITLFLYVLFAVFLFSHKKGNRRSNLIFAVFCLANGMFILADIFHIYRHTLYEVFPSFLEILWESFFFLSGPLLYIYTLSMTRKEFTLKTLRPWHLLPFIGDCIFRVYRFLTTHDVKAVLMDKGYYIHYWELKTRYLSMDLHIIGYAVASLIIIYRFREQLKHQFSAIEKIRLSWLHFVLYGFIAVHIAHLSKLLIPGLPPMVRGVLGLTSHVAALSFVTVVLFKAMSQQEIFSGLIEQHEQEQEQDQQKQESKPAKQKYAKTALTETQINKYKEKLLHHMDTEKPYLDPELNITQLANQIDIPPHDMSQLLNQGLDQNFYFFVNKYRIEESKRMLSEKKIQKTVLEVLFETGFSSKSTFNRIFKQYTGATPTQYMKAAKSA